MTPAQTEARTLWAALAAFQADVPTVPKGKTATVRTKDGGNYTYRYADLADVTQVALPLLAEHGLSFICSPEVDDSGHQLLVGVLMHQSGDSLRGTLALNVGAASSPQQVGSALTYARRYLLGCLTGVVTDDDDDGQAAAQTAKRTRKAAAPPAEPETPQAGTRTVRRRARTVEDTPLPAEPPAPVKGPAAKPPGVVSHDAPQVAPPSQPLTDGLHRGLMAACSRLGIDPELDRPMRLALWSALLARHITSSSDLGRSEALTLLRRMNDCETGAVEWDYSIETGAVTLRHVDREPDDYRPN